MNETKSWFFAKIKKIDNPFVRIIKIKRRGLKLIKFEM